MDSLFKVFGLLISVLSSLKELLNEISDLVSLGLSIISGVGVDRSEG